MNPNIDFNKLITSIGRCCLDTQCQACEKDKCLIGYCKINLVNCLKNNQQFIQSKNKIPLFDTKVFDEDFVIDTLGVILNQCKNCSTYHNDDCIINILRTTCEVILLGSPQNYEGSVLVYLNNINSLAEKTNKQKLKKDTIPRIYNAYIRHKKD